MKQMFLFLIFLLLVPIFVFAQNSDIPEEETPGGETIAQEEPTPIEEPQATSTAPVPGAATSTPALATSTPQITPAPAQTSTPRPVQAPPVVPAPTPQTPATTSVEVLDMPSNNMPLYGLILAVLASLAGLGAFVVFKLQAKASTNQDTKKETSRDRCGKIKQTLEQRKGELETAKSGFSIQDVLIKELEKQIEKKKSEIEGKIKKELENKAKELLTPEEKEIIEAAQKLKKEYDDLVSKYEKAKKLYESLTQSLEALKGEVHKLEIAYQGCMAGTATVEAVPNMLKGIEIPSVAKKKRAIIVHCWDGYPEYCWYPWVKKKLEEEGFEVTVPAFPETNAPNLQKWLPVLKEAVGTPDENTYLIGHSVGCITILRYIEKLAKDQKIGGVVMVAGFTDDLGFEELKNFFTTNILFEQIKEKTKHFVAIHSDNDPYVPLKHADIFKEKLGAEVVVKHGMKHFSGSVDKEDSCTELPDVVESVLKISK